MRTRAVVLALLLILISTTSINAEHLNSVGTIDDTSLDWEGVATSTMVYEGELSDPQDFDNITLGNDGGAVHSIQLVYANEPLVITVWNEGIIHEQEEGDILSLLVSGTGNSMWVEITSANFTGPNSYRVEVHSNSADESVELGVLTAAGYIHQSDTEGDRSHFTTGGNALVELQWNGSESVEFVGYMTHSGNSQVSTLTLDDWQGSLNFTTPMLDSRHDYYEFSIWARTNDSTGWWELDKSIHSESDAHCPHDCPNTVDETLFESDAVSISNEQWGTNGNLSQHDSVDVYPIYIEGELWETHRLIATIDGDDVEVQLQSWNNTAEFLSLLEIEDGVNTVGLNMTPGYHLVKVTRTDSATGTNEYHLALQTINVTSDDAGPINPDEIIDRWKEFIPFYIGIGLLMLAPMAYVIWSLRGTKLSEEVQAHERGRLKRLRKRLAKLIENNASEDEINSALSMLEEVQWRATEAEMGEATLTHHTDSVTLKAWRIGSGSLLVGIHVEQAPWELAALRFEAAGGPSWKISDVSPNSLFDGDEIFLDTLDVGCTRFLRLKLEGEAEGLDLHLSGLVEGKPLAAIPARALLMNEE